MKKLFLFFLTLFLFSIFFFFSRSTVKQSFACDACQTPEMTTCYDPMDQIPPWECETGNCIGDPCPVEYCGDGSCNNGEDCSSCSGDCGECPPPEPYCGDGSCNNGEDCSSCSGDCGECCIANSDCGYSTCTESCGGGQRRMVCTDLNGCYAPDYGPWEDCNTQACCTTDYSDCSTTRACDAACDSTGTFERTCTDSNGCGYGDVVSTYGCDGPPCACVPICATNGTTCNQDNGCRGICQICDNSCVSPYENCSECSGTPGTQTCTGHLASSPSTSCTITQSCNTNLGAVSCDCGPSSGYTQVGCVTGAECTGDLGGGCHYCVAPPNTTPTPGGTGGATHTECQGTSCITVPGAGTNGCAWDPDCNTGGDTTITCYRCSGSSCQSYTTTATSCPTTCAGCTSSPSYSVSGVIYNDIDDSGTINAGDTPFTISSLRVKLQNNQDANSNTADGTFSIPSVYNGTYTISLDTPTGYKSVIPASQSVTLNGANVTSVNFLVKAYNITVNIYNDSNNNGEKNPGETPYTPAVSATLSKNGTGVETKQTSSGSYTFKDYPSGNYTVGIPSISGYAITTANPVLSNINGADVTVEIGISKSYSVSGNIFIDNDKNGVFDKTTESVYSAGSSNIEVRKTNCTGALVSGVGTNGIITTNTGTYNLSIPFGTYALCYTSVPSSSGYFSTTPNSIIITVPCTQNRLNNYTCSSFVR